MNNKTGSSPELKDFFRRTKDILKLRPALGNIYFSRKKELLSLQKLNLFLQIWGKKDIHELEGLSSRARVEFIRKRFKDKTVCIVLADGLSFFQEIKDEAKKRRVALFYSDLSQKECRERIRSLFLSMTSHQIMTSGELLEILGLGVLIIGDSGIGKSESALELVSRGYRFISDDVVQIKREANGKLFGIAPPLTRHFMEIRGLGIINIKEMFGPDAISKKAEIDLVIRLKKLHRGKEYDRIGLKFPEDYEILGVKVPQINIPVAPGRNIATLIEVACKAHILKEKGYHAPLDLVRKLNRALSLR